MADHEVRMSAAAPAGDVMLAMGERAATLATDLESRGERYVHMGYEEKLQLERELHALLTARPVAKLRLGLRGAHS